MKVGCLPTKIEANYSWFTTNQWRNWCLIYILIVLVSAVPPQIYTIWMFFVKACYLLCRRSLRKSSILKADVYLVKFCEKATEYLGKPICTPNMHLHLHIKESALDFGQYMATGVFHLKDTMECVRIILLTTSNSSSKTRGAAAPRTRITWVSFVGSEEPLLKIIRLVELLRTNSSPISNCRRSKSAIFLARNINYNINSLLRLHVGTCIIYIYLYIYIGLALHTGSRNENNIGAACGSP